MIQGNNQFQPGRI